MTTTLIERKWLYIDGKGHARINGKKELSFDLPKEWDFGEIEYVFKEACLKYDLAIPKDEKELHRIIRDTVSSFGKRTIGKPENKTGKVDVAESQTPRSKHLNWRNFSRQSLISRR